ncbi:MAG: hypothetical protein COB30_004895 [Ectothiorhodospiraceae bacterium]|nr:hypothetical protein [Ectothiorhodospiraceae bacterium]MBN4053043.1 hypothetical protein [Gammaproteobacteria bacterium AH-315-K14]
MKQAVIIIIFLNLIGCSLIGHELGKVVDNAIGETNNKYRNDYTADGPILDAEMLEAFLLRKKEDKKEEVDNRACKELGTHQVCTYYKGCWCEKIEQTRVIYPLD